MDTFKKYYNYIIIPTLFVTTFLGWYFNMFFEATILYTFLWVFHSFVIKNTKYNLYLSFFVPMLLNTNFGDGGSLANSSTFGADSLEVYLMYSLQVLIIYSTFFYGIIKDRKNIKIDYVLVGLIILVISMIPSIIWTVDRYNTMLMTGVYLNAILLYFFFKSQKSIKKDNYFILGGLIALMAILQMLVKLKIGDAIDMVLHEQITIGWAISNNIGQYIVIAIPFISYFAVRYKRYGYVFHLLSLLMILALVLTGARSAYAALLVIVPFIGGYVLLYENWKHRVRDIVIVLPLIAIAVYIVHDRGMLSAFWQRLFEVGLNSHGRGALFDQAIRHFNDNVLIGTGVFTSSNYLVRLTCYHNVGLDVLANSGIVGFFGFSVFCTMILIQFAKNITKYNFMLFLSIVSLFIFAMLDTMHTSPIQLMVFFVALAFIEEKEDTTSE